MVNANRIANWITKHQAIADQAYAELHEALPEYQPDQDRMLSTQMFKAIAKLAESLSCWPCGCGFMAQGPEREECERSCARCAPLKEVADALEAVQT